MGKYDKYDESADDSYEQLPHYRHQLQMEVISEGGGVQGGMKGDQDTPKRPIGSLKANGEQQRQIAKPSVRQVQG